MTAKHTRPAIADIYELSPMQEAMLFQSIYAPDSLAYFDQFHCVIAGDLHVEAFGEAWQALTSRHAVFRTSFHWQDLPKPVQVVEEHIHLPWTFEDWRGLAVDAQTERWQNLLEADRRRGFQLDRAPLVRCHLVRVEDRRYFFAWSHHHIILDGWCLSLVLTDLIESYRALKNGRRPALPAVRPYRDYITWLQQQDRAKAEAFWKNELRGFAAPTELPADIAPHSERSVMADRNEEVRLDGELSRKLRDFAASIQVTPNTLAQGAWAILLQRYGGEPDVLFGATVSGRPPEVRGVESMVGVFINTIPVRVRVEPEALLPDWLRKLQAQQASRLPFAFAALGDIQQWSEIPRGAALFNSNLIFMNYPLSREVIRGGGEFEIRDAQMFEQTDVPLTVQVMPGEPWVIEATYDSSRFDAEAIRRMLGHFIHLLEEFVAEPRRQLASFPILTGAERRQLFDDFNNSRVEFDAERTLVHRLEEVAARHPERIVVECDGRTLAARSLNARANQLARCLLNEAALDSEDVVALLMRRSERLIESILAVWKCNAAYIPIDPDYPADRVKTIVESAGAKLVITEQGCIDQPLCASLQATTRVVTLESFAEIREQQDPADLGRAIRPHDLAYVIFTSGSTGKPKGAMVEHVGMLNHLLSKVDDLGIDAASVVAQTASHCFDISLWQMFAAPVSGGKTVVYTDGTVLEPDRFIERIEADGITIMEVVPSYLAVLLGRVEDRDEAFAKLRYLQVTGEAVTPALVERWFRKFPHIPVANAYGPTECSDNVTHYTMHEPPRTPSIPIGKPLRNFNIYIVDEYMNLCPVGMKGEICASGIGVGRGYLHDPARTAAAFLEDPFREARGIRLYKTGDIGCYMPDGNLLLFGRKDNQVKIRGFRIELGEIEVALARLAGIRAAVVVDRRDEGKDHYLCAYYTVKAGVDTGGEALAGELRHTLPDYMIPAAFVAMAELPLTANGKIDRSRLPAPDLAERAAAADWVAPRNEMESRLAEVWGEVLGVKNPGIHDNFFSLGGDSILSMQVVSRAKQAGVRLNVVDLFRAPTIAGLALRAVKLDTAQPAGRGRAASAGPVPLTPVQRHFLETTGIAPHHYNQSLLVETPERVDAARLERSIRFAAGRHDSLRLRFKPGDAGWHQTLSPSLDDLPFIIEDLSTIPPAEQQAAIQTIAARLQASLDLTAGPLMVAALFEKGEGRPASLLLIVHHLLIDGVSWRILIEEILAAYRQIEQGREPRLPEPATGFAEWSRRLAGYARDRISTGERQYWLDVARAAIKPLPVDFQQAADANTVASGEALWVQLDERLTAALLKDVPRAFNTQIDDVLLTALALAFREWTGSDRLQLDLESHGREPLFDDLDISRTTGWFTAEYPAVLRLEPDAGDATIQLKAIKEQLRQIPGHGLGYGLLRYDADDAAMREELAARAPAQALFNYLGQTDRTAAGLDGWKVDMEGAGSDRNPDQLREYLIEINGLVAEGRVKLSFAYSRNFHQRETIERLAQGFNTHLAALIEACVQAGAGGFTPSDFPAAALTQESLDLLLEDLQRSGVSRPASALEDVYVLSPVQQGMLFHSLYTPESDTYFNQLHCLVQGPLDAAIFREAWAKVNGHHPALRTSFHWQALPHPVQVVHRGASAEWLVEDWSSLAPGEQEARWLQHLSEDRRRQFNLARAPLMRFSLFRITDQVYRFNWSHHHLLLDGWSSAIVLNDVLSVYETLVNGGPVAFDARRPFRESIEWLGRADTARAQSYWRDKLAGFTTPTALVLGSPEMEGRLRAGRYAEEEVAVNAELSGRLQVLARERGITLNTIAQGAWALLLSRYSGEPDVVYGSVVSGRPPELEGADKMVGVFINTLPARVRVEPDRALVAWLDEMQVEQIEREQYAYTSLTEIQRWGEVPAGTSLFESLLIFENYPTEAFLQQGSGGLSVTQVHAVEPNNYAVTLVVTPGQTIALKAMYDDGRFDGATMQRLLGHYEMILRQIAEAPRQTIGAVEILTPAEREQILCDWNHTAAPVPQDTSFIRLFEDRASEFAGLTAVEFNGQPVSYRELNERANQLARLLLSVEAIEAGDRIAVLMPRSVKMVESILAIWKCNAAYVPIDPDYPRERIKTILADCGARLVLIDTDACGLDEEAGDGPFKLIRLDQLDARLGQQATANLADPPAPSDLAYVIYTSGSTGKPKGAMVEHRGMLNHLLAMSCELGLGPGGVVAQTASHCFDISMWQFFAALTAGARTVIYDNRTVLNPDALIARFDDDGVQFAQFVPSYLTVFLDALECRNDPGLLGHLKWLVTIGEILKPAYVRRWFALYPNVWLMNAYGPTEASDSVTHFNMRQPPARASVPIGRPIQNMHIYVLDRQMHLCPIGAKGEICIGGVGVGRGYLGDDERTRAAFVPDPFADDPGARLYKTGDLGCYTPEGDLLFFGRRDHQVKIRGHRIELGEIESALVKLAGVRNAAVVTRENRDQQALCAYVTLQAGVAKQTAELTAALAAALPAYMIPDVVRILPELPLTPGGKVDRNRLPDPEIDIDDAGQAPPRTAIEVELTEIWKAVLGLERIGIDDHFTDLGGHSLNAIQIVSRIRGRWRRDISFADIFEADTIRTLAARLEALSESDDALIPRLAESEYYETSHTQKRIWLASRTREGSAVYNIATSVWLEGRLDPSALKAALQMLVERHESLRTVFVMAKGELRQQVRPVEQAAISITEIDLSHDPAGEAEAVARARRLSAAPLDLAHGPLFAALLIQTAEARHLLALNLHHMVGDAWSLEVIFDELLKLYAAKVEDRPPLLAPLTIQYRDYAAWHNRRLVSPEAKKERDYWLGKLSADMPRTAVPSDYPNHGPLAFNGDSVNLRVADELFEGLKRLAEDHKTSVYAVILAAIYSLLFRYTNQTEVIAGTQTSGRLHKQLEGQVGCFVNTLVLRATVRGTDRAGDVIGTVSRTLSEAIRHQEYPFDRLLEDLKVRLAGDQSPLFDIQVDYAPNLQRRGRLSGAGDLTITELSEPERAAKFALSFLISDPAAGDGLLIETVYNTALYAHDSIVTLNARLRRVLQAFAEDPTRLIDAIVLNEATAAPHRIEVNLNLPD